MKLKGVVKRDEKWTDKNGKVWRVADMTESHVRATLRLLLRTMRESDIEVSDLFSWRLEEGCDATDADIY
jgi:hypothetical protein